MMAAFLKNVLLALGAVFAAYVLILAFFVAVLCIAYALNDKET